MLTQQLKLGKQPVRHDERTFLFAHYAGVSLPLPPDETDWIKGRNKWGMMKNDTVGDCTCAAAGHYIMSWTADCGKIITPSDAAIIKAYSAITGYNSKTGENDNGAVELDVLNYWRKNGIGGHKIGAYAKVQVGNIDQIKQAIYLFGGVYLGIDLPMSAQTQNTWDVAGGGTGKKGSWGGHAVPVFSYDSEGLTCITWGAPKKMTWAFFAEYCDEAYCLFSNDFIKGGKSPNGFAMESLQADLKAL